MSEKIVQLNEEVIKGQIKELVRGSVEETLNGLLEAEAQQLTNAAKSARLLGYLPKPVESLVKGRGFMVYWAVFSRQTRRVNAGLSAPAFTWKGRT